MPAQKGLATNTPSFDLPRRLLERSEVAEDVRLVGEEWGAKPVLKIPATTVIRR
jgi:hypothetical protein